MSIIVYDTNIVIALLSPTDTLHEAAITTAQAWETRSADIVISAVTWAELRTGALRRGPDAEKALANFRDHALDDIINVNTAIADIAAGYRAKDLGLRMPDALIIATGTHIEAHAVLTSDKKLSRTAPGLVQLIPTKDA